MSGLPWGLVGRLVTLGASLSSALALNSLILLKYSDFIRRTLDSGTSMFQRVEKCLEALVAPFSAAYLPICALCSGEYPLYFSLVDTLRGGLLSSSCFTSGFTLSLADRMSFEDRVVEALTVTSGSLKVSLLSFLAKYLSIDISDDCRSPAVYSCQLSS